MVGSPSSMSFGTSWSPPKDEEEDLSSEGSISMEGEDGGDGEG